MQSRDTIKTSKHHDYIPKEVLREKVKPWSRTDKRQAPIQ